MMGYDDQLRLQTFLDGELPEKEAREVAALIARDAEARALFNELKNTRHALAASQHRPRVPESREFYWSKVQREIERREPGPQATLVGKSSSIFTLLRRLGLPASVVAALALAVFFVGSELGMFGVARGATATMTTTTAGAFTYQDYAHGMTLVWLPYPAETEFAKNMVH